VLGVDLGSRRIGLATSDRSGVLASPLRVLTRTGDPDADHRAIVDAAREVEAERIVIGLPRSLSGADGPAARAVRVEVAAIQAIAGSNLPVDTYDERFTTVVAERGLMEANARARAPERRAKIDAAAAAVMLQSWLDASG
jgi:putative Holliday junction resolvase